ncbi:MAG: hypothetical protein QXU98_12885 [Candidatus Parvarchaeota archaeon]
MRATYELELLALLSTSGLFAFLTAMARVEVLKIVYRFATLMTLIAFVGIAIAAANAYGLSTAVLTAILLLFLIVFIFEVLLLIIELFSPLLAQKITRRFKLLDGLND